MLYVPLLTELITEHISARTVDDGVDRLNHRVTAFLLVFFSLATAGKQYYGKPIQCWVPNQFPLAWEVYAEDYCLIQHSYYLPLSRSIPANPEDRRDEISYYRWVPIVLALQAFLFYLPSAIWNTLINRTAVNPKFMVTEARKMLGLSVAERDNQMSALAELVEEALDSERPSKVNSVQQRISLSATSLYLIMKLHNVLNIAGQLILLNRFLGSDYTFWGVEVLRDVANGHLPQESPLFPRVILCDFAVRRLGNQHVYTVQCVLMMNMIHEKLYLFLWFWLLLVIVVTVINFLMSAIDLLLPARRAKRVLRRLTMNDQLSSTPADLHYFALDYLGTDGALLLAFVDDALEKRRFTAKPRLQAPSIVAPRIRTKSIVNPKSPLKIPQKVL